VYTVTIASAAAAAAAAAASPTRLVSYYELIPQLFYCMTVQYDTQYLVATTVLYNTVPE